MKLNYYYDALHPTVFLLRTILSSFTNFRNLSKMKSDITNNYAMPFYNPYAVLTVASDRCLFREKLFFCVRFFLSNRNTGVLHVSKQLRTQAVYSV